jgi:hypothetical protein
MSNSASIAAAKRRRGTPQNPPVASSGSSRTINRVQSEPSLENIEKTQKRISPIQILGMHENRLEFLERQHNNIALALNQYPNPNEEKIITLKDLEDFRQAFQKLSSSEKKLEEENLNLQKIKKEVSEELTKTQLNNLASKKDVDILITSMRKEVLNESFKTLEDKINALKISNNEVSSSTSFSKEIQEVTKTLTKKIEDSIPKNTVTLKQLDDVKIEVNKKFDGMQIPKNTVTLKQLDDIKIELNKKFDGMQIPQNTVTLKQLDDVKIDLNKKFDGMQIPQNTVTLKQLDDVKIEFNKKFDGMQIPQNTVTLKQLDDVKIELNKKIDSLSNNTQSITSIDDTAQEKLTLTAKARIDTLESKVKALEAILLKQ